MPTVYLKTIVNLAYCESICTLVHSRVSLAWSLDVGMLM